MKRTHDFSNTVTQNIHHNKVALVERNPEPFGYKLISLSKSFKGVTTELSQLAEEVTKADTLAHAATVSRLELIAEQMSFLQSQACNEVVKLRQGLLLNHAACNFRKIPGKTYYLYKRLSGQKYFSMLSPEEWNGALSHDFLGSFRLETDMTWTPTEKIPTKEKHLKMINSILNCDLIPQKDQCMKMLLESSSEQMVVDTESVTAGRE